VSEQPTALFEKVCGCMSKGCLTIKLNNREGEHLSFTDLQLRVLFLLSSLPGSEIIYN